MSELWRWVPGLEGYVEVSDQGKMRSANRVYKDRAGRERTFKGRPIPLWMGAHGYWMASLPTSNGQIKMAVHRAVLLAFSEPCPEGMEACHNDGDRGNPCIENLRWDTRKGNHADKIGHGTDQRGERAGTAKLSDEKVIQVMRSNESSRILGARFGVSGAAIRDVRRGKTWGHITGLRVWSEPVREQKTNPATVSAVPGLVTAST